MKEGTYPVGDEGYQVVPEDMQHQKQCHEKVEDVVDWEHLNKLKEKKSFESWEGNWTWAASDVVE